MARRINLSKLKNLARKIERQQKKAIQDYNREVRKYNRDIKKAVNNYNREVRNYNSKVRTAKQKIQSELNKLKSSPSSTRFKVYERSVHSFHTAYETVDAKWSQMHLSPAQQELFDSFEKENLNSLSLMNILAGLEPESFGSDPNSLQNSNLEELISISSDLDKGWRGALFALNPFNPDAARHFCTSAREIFNQIIETVAPDDIVFENDPDCDTTQRGNPTRRSKIRFLLGQKNMADETVEEFVEQDIQNIHELFRLFNDGTHGSAGKFEHHKLLAIKKRVEDGIRFLVQIAK